MLRIMDNLKSGGVSEHWKLLAQKQVIDFEEFIWENIRVSVDWIWGV